MQHFRRIWYAYGMRPSQPRALFLAGALTLAASLAAGCSYALPRSNGGVRFLEERAPAPVARVAVGAKYAGWIAGAPAVAALIPVAALAWATPWVDLPAAVDLVTAPSRALLFLSAGDTSVPIAGGRALREAMGGPEPFVLAGDHETSGICFGFVLRRADEFFLE